MGEKEISKLLANCNDFKSTISVYSLFIKGQFPFYYYKDIPINENYYYYNYNMTRSHNKLDIYFEDGGFIYNTEFYYKNEWIIKSIVQ